MRYCITILFFTILSLQNLQAQIVKTWSYLNTFSGYGGEYSASNFFNYSNTKFHVFMNSSINGTSSLCETIIANTNGVINEKKNGDSIGMTVNSTFVYKNRKYCAGNGFNRPPNYMFSCALIYKYDLNNNLLDSVVWEDNYFFSASYMNIINDTIYVTTAADYASQGFKIGIATLDTNLNLIQYKHIAGNGTYNLSPFKTTVLNDGRIKTIIQGYPFKILELDRNLNVIQTDSFKFPDYKSINDAIFVNDGIIVDAYLQQDNSNTYYPPSSAPRDALLKFDFEGNFIWETHFPSPAYFYGADIDGIGKALDGNIMLLTDDYLVKLDSFGNEKWRTKAHTQPDDEFVRFNNIGQTPDSIYYVGGYCCYNTTDWTYSLRLTTIDSSSVVGIHDLTQLTNTINIYPNPSSGIFNLSAGNLSGNYTLNIHDVLGRLITTQKLNLSSDKIATFEILSKGLYIVTLENKENRITQKIIVE